MVPAFPGQEDVRKMTTPAAWLNASFQTPKPFNKRLHSPGFQLLIEIRFVSVSAKL
jgi:hypothetical protein